MSYSHHQPFSDEPNTQFIDIPKPTLQPYGYAGQRLPYSSSVKYYRHPSALSSHLFSEIRPLSSGQNWQPIVGMSKLKTNQQGYAFSSESKKKSTTDNNRYGYAVWNSDYSSSSSSNHALSTMSQTQGTVKPFVDFNASYDLEVVTDAMKGVFCEFGQVLSILCYRSNYQRQQIRHLFKSKHKVDLVQELISELHGEYEDLAVALLYTPAEFDARELEYALRGSETKNTTLIEILATRTNEEIHSIAVAYKKLFGKDFEEVLAQEPYNHFTRLLLALSVGGRDDWLEINPKKVTREAKHLSEIEKKGLGSDESMFNVMMVMDNHAHLRAVFAEYLRLTGKDIEQTLKDEFSGDILDGMLILVKATKNLAGLFAERAHISMKGHGTTNERDLIRIIVSRCENDMVQIKDEYQHMYNTTLEEDIKDNVKGKCRRVLLELIKGGR